MKDEEMTATLSRLRIRACILADVPLLKAALRSSALQGGVSLAHHTDAISLARMNETVKTLNLRKATTQAASTHKALVTNYASHSSATAITAHEREALVAYNGAPGAKQALSRIPLFLEMPVVYRVPNQSVAMDITNRAFGTFAGWDLVKDKWGLTVPRGVIVKFSSDASWTLTGMDPGYLPIMPTRTTSTFTFTPDGVAGASRSTTRRQILLQPGFAMTVHSAQRITADGGSWSHSRLDIRQIRGLSLSFRTPYGRTFAGFNNFPS
ncbi:hypothetical protein CF327_g4709 [Tilletia walkeri]|nr:hypothetical protein CF327_g4709 [Tilletia walkeri]